MLNDQWLFHQYSMQIKASGITWFQEEARQTEQIIIKLKKKEGL